MDLIERYVVEVGRHLPARSDVPDELRSLLSDALEQRAVAAGRPPDDVMAVEVLREFGEPVEVAERYAPQRYLVGPELYPLYESIAIGIIVISLVIRLVVMAFRLLVDGQAPRLASFPGAAGEFILNTFVLLAMLTLVFFVLERVLPASKAESSWDPRDLPPLPGETSSKIERRNVEISIWELTAGLILLNVFPQWIGIPFGHQYRWSIASPAELAIPLPVLLLNTYWFGALLLNIVLWRTGEWTRTLRSAQLLVGLGGLAVIVTMLIGADSPSAAQYQALARVVRGVLWGVLFYQLWTAARRLWHVVQDPAVARSQPVRMLGVLIFALVTTSATALAQQPFHSHDNFTQYELLDPTSNQFAITYFVTERRAGATVLLNQTRSGSAGSDISVFDSQTGKPLKFDYLSGAELAKDGTPGRFDPAEHYIRAHLPRPVPAGGEGRVKILKTYKDEKSYFIEGGDVVFRRSLGIARNAIVLPRGYRLLSSNVASQMLTLPDGRLKLSFEHAHGYPADVAIRARKAEAQAPAASIPNDKAFDFSKVLFDLGDPETHALTMTREYLESRLGNRAALREGSTALTVTDVDTGQPLKVMRTGKSVWAELANPITAEEQSARLRVTQKTSDPRYRMESALLRWEGTFAEPRATILLPNGWDVSSVSVMSTVTQVDGRVAVQIYNGNPGPLHVTVRAVKR